MPGPMREWVPDIVGRSGDRRLANLLARGVNRSVLAESFKSRSSGRRPSEAAGHRPRPCRCEVITITDLAGEDEVRPGAGGPAVVNLWRAIPAHGPLTLGIPMRG
jgi:hypothetical protein